MPKLHSRLFMFDSDMILARIYVVESASIELIMILRLVSKQSGL